MRQHDLFEVEENEEDLYRQKMYKERVKCSTCGGRTYNGFHREFFPEHKMSEVIYENARRVS